MCVREEKWRETVYDRDRGRFYFYIVDLPFFTALNNFSHNSTSANGFAIAFTYGRTAASLEVELLLFFFELLSDIPIHYFAIGLVPFLFSRLGEPQEMLERLSRF